MPVVQNELACSPFTDGRSRTLQHVIFESRFLGLDPNYNFLWLWCELTSVAFSGKLRKLAAWDSTLFGELQSNNNEYPRHENLRPYHRTLMPRRYTITPALQSAVRCGSNSGKSFIDKWVEQILVQAWQPGAVDFWRTRVHRWEGMYEKFNPVHYPNHHVTKAKKEHAALPRDQPTWCPLVREYDPNYAVFSCEVWSQLWTEAYQFTVSRVLLSIFSRLLGLSSSRWKCPPLPLGSSCLECSVSTPERC